LPARWRPLVPELLKFGAVGVINTVLDFLIYNLLLGIGPLKAKVVSTVVATTASYVMNRQWTFGERDKTSVRREYVLFFGLNLVGLAIQLAVLGGAKYGLGFDENGTTADKIWLNVANAFGIGVAMVFRFWAYRAFVFKTPQTADEAVTTEVEAVEVAFTDVALTDLHPHTPAHSTPAQRRAADEFAELTAPLEVELELEELTSPDPAGRGSTRP
jgi:putative flippase GtrA